MIQVNRKTLRANTPTAFNFNNESGKYLVKNFTNRYIYVCFGAEYDEDKAVKIAKDSSQIVVANEHKHNFCETCRTDTLTICTEFMGEVEVQQLWY